MTSINAGLPNITGDFKILGQDSALQASGSGAFYRGSAFNNYANYHNPNVTMYSVGFNASRSSSIYGSSDTVTPTSLTCVTCIRY